MQQALIGAQAGVIAVWCTIPLEKLQQRSATERDANGNPVSYLKLAQTVYDEGGLGAFWNGAGVLTVQVAIEKGRLDK